MTRAPPGPIRHGSAQRRSAPDDSSPGESLPDAPNLYALLWTDLDAGEVAALYEALGFRVRRSAWTEFEIGSEWAELVLVRPHSEPGEARAPILMNGSVADAARRADALAAPLRAAGIGFSIECYDERRVLVREIVDGPPRRD